MKKHIATLLVSSMLLFSSLGYATVTEKAKMAKALAGVDQSTVVIFDIDSTILRTNQTLGSDLWFHYNFDRLAAEGVDEKKAEGELLSQWILLQKITGVKPVEDSTPKLIKDMQDKNIKVMALTARPLELVDTTISQLKSIGVDLSRNPPSRKNFVVGHGLKAERYYNGILFCGGLKKDKGTILNEFFEKIKFEPTTVVFVDDRRNNVESVDKALATKGLDCRCIRYSAVDPMIKSFNQEIAEVQMEFFGKLLSDEAARAILKSRKE